MIFNLTILGGGIFGLTAAISLQKRGYACQLLDKQSIPAELAATTDISKVIRMEYGKDEDYMAMMEETLPGWRMWNAEFCETLYHETGVCMLTKNRMKPGDFEWESYQMLIKRGHHPLRMNHKSIGQQFPAWNDAAYTDGFFHTKGGFAKSGRVLECLKKKAVEIGVQIREEVVIQKIEIADSGTIQLLLGDQSTIQTPKLIVAAGAWTPYLVPELMSQMKVTGHPVFHLKAKHPENFEMDKFYVFTADIAKTGWYGFPVHPKTGVIKIANHGVGLRINPNVDERTVYERDLKNLKEFLKKTFPALLHADVVYTRRCLYCDTLDEHFWIDWHPNNENLMVATGGSGHGFKFAPILGDLIADCFENKSNPFLSKFKWRNLDSKTRGEEAARHHDPI